MRNKISTFCFLLLGFALLNACGQLESEADVTYFQYLANGADLYKKNCENCHGTKGEGFQNLYPALTDTSYLRENKSKLACMIKYGMSDSLKVNGKWYQEKMPAHTELGPIDIAQIIVYVTNHFGNKQGFYDYKKVQQDLLNCKP